MHKKPVHRRGGETLGLLTSFLWLSFMLFPLTSWAGPQALSEEEMEKVYAQGMTIIDNISGSAVAANGSSSVANPANSAVQVGVGGSETNQNQIDMAGSSVDDKNQQVVNAGGNNKGQNNLNKAMQANGSAQSSNSGVLINAVQSAVVLPINVAPVSSSTLTGNIEQHNVVSILAINF